MTRASSPCRRRAPGAARRRNPRAASSAADPGPRNAPDLGQRARPAGDRRGGHRLVQELIETTGICPLVISTDNGPAFKPKLFEDFFDEHQIVHLKNLPHTPQHNAHAERGVKEVKQELNIPKGRLPPAPKGLARRAVDACRYLNETLIRGVLGGLTAAQSAARLPITETLVERPDFFAETRSALAKAVPSCTSARARRLADRKAIFETLVRFNLITITRGGKDAADLNTDKTR